jgi:hypothetical protein
MICALLCTACVSNAYGYIDMGTGSYVIQIVIAGFLGTLFTLKGYARGISERIANLFKRK